MIAKRLAAAALALTLAAPAAAQEIELSVARIYGSRDFSPDRVSVNWMDDGRHYTILEREDGRTDLYKVDASSGERELLLRGDYLVPPGEDEPVEISSYQFSADGSKLLIAADTVRIWRRSRRATYCVWDFNAKTLTPVSTQPGYQAYAKFSPDARYVAFVRDHDIYVSELASGEERALTEDGSEDIINGTTDWVYEEELSLVDGFRWSPDGKRIAFWRFDQSPIPPFYLIDLMTLYPELTPVRYPKAGTQNSEVRLGVVELATGQTTWIDVEPEDDGDFYIARMDFANSSSEIWFQRLNRHQNRMELLLADVRTGESRVVMTDSDAAWLDVQEPIWIEGGKMFVYLSERDGYAQLYLFARDGSIVSKLTTGDWDVRNVYGVDERMKLVYFSAAADGPLSRPLYRVGLDGRDLTRISGPTGSHQVSFDPTYRYYVDTYSRAGVPPVQTLRRANGQVVRTLADNAALKQKLDALELAPPEFLEIPLEGGLELNAWLIKPPDFDPGRRYPLLMYVYGGPGSQTVSDSWGGDRYLWHEVLAREGYLVASVDNRGTGARGARFKKMTYLNLGRYESQDQIAAARYFAALPYVDAGRIGIWGWSYGGYMAALCMLKGADVFRAAISGAPVTDWRLYDTIYTERYMRTPQENLDGYAESAPLAYADRLQGRLLLVHGTGDDNVHVQNTLQLVERLIEADKQFELRLYPNEPHGIRGETKRVNLYTLMTEFLKQNL
jgi:dipeptidyl-peptidase-4